jgi:hypothetical protein
VSSDGSADNDGAELSVVASGQAYVVQHRGTDLVIGRKSGETVLWQAETVPVADLPDAARTALAEGRQDSQELNIALQSIVQAFVQRGG